MYPTKPNGLLKDAYLNIKSLVSPDVILIEDYAFQGFFECFKQLYEQSCAEPGLSRECVLSYIRLLLSISGLLNAIREQYQNRADNLTENYQSKALNRLFSQIIDSIYSKRRLFTCGLFTTINSYGDDRDLHKALNEAIMFTFVMMYPTKEPTSKNYLELITGIAFGPGGLFYPEFMKFEYSQQQSEHMKKEQVSHPLFVEYQYFSAVYSDMFWKTDFEQVQKVLDDLSFYSVESLRISEGCKHLVFNNDVVAEPHKQMGCLVGGMYTSIVLMEQVCMRFLGNEAGTRNIGINRKLDLFGKIVYILSNQNFVITATQSNMNFSPFIELSKHLGGFLMSNEEVLVAGENMYSKVDMVYSRWLGSLSNEYMQCSRQRRAGTLFMLDFTEHVVGVLSERFVEHELVRFVVPLIGERCFANWAGGFESANVVFLSVLSNKKFRFGYKYTVQYTKMLKEMYLNGLAISLFEICYMASIMCCTNAGIGELGFELSKQLLDSRLYAKSDSEKGTKTEFEKMFVRSLQSLPANRVDEWGLVVDGLIKEKMQHSDLVGIKALLEQIGNLALTTLDNTKRYTVLKMAMDWTHVIAAVPHKL
ncbi:hypothetical protein BB558_005818 [Smittium angustum]|nr:hypothetical protein BB558_005818 [Smittium angustum]